MNNRPSQAHKKKRHSWLWQEQLAAFCLAVGLLTLTGPFETYAMKFGPRLAYWSLSLAVGWAAVLTLIFILRRLPLSSAWPPLQRISLAVILAALPTAAAVATIETMLRPARNSAPTALLFVNVALIFGLIGTGLIARIRPRIAPPPPPPPVRNAFLDRLPPTLGTYLISLSMQDHYVSVTTLKGRELIHMRFSDALLELNDYPGQQIHRSHWIAAWAFTGVARDKGRLMAHLVDNRALPISRSFAKATKSMAPHRPVPKTLPKKSD